MKTSLMKILLIGGSLTLSACATAPEAGRHPAVESTVLHSSVIARATYDYGTRNLLLHFRSGRVYEYEGIAPDLFQEFLDASSKGAFYAHRIRGWFDSRRVDLPQQYLEIARGR